VHLEWGQGLAYLMRAELVPGLGIIQGVAAYTHLADPVRRQLTPATGGRDYQAFLDATTDDVYGSTAAPARYTNRDSTSSAVGDYSLDGNYYLSINAGFTDPGEPALTVPYTIAIDVIGRVEPGPDYRVAVSPPAKSPATGSMSPGAGGSSSRAADARADDDGLSSGAVAAIAGAGFVAVVGAAIFAVRRRRKSPGH
jgi:hypothetical protein